LPAVVEKERADRILGRDPFAGMEPLPEEPPAAPVEKEKILGRDPFAGLELPPEPEPVRRAPAPAAGKKPRPAPAPAAVEKAPPPPPVVEAPPPPPVVVEASPPLDSEALAARLEARLRAIETAPPGMLKGKGVWLLYSAEANLAIEMALAIGATHVFYKTGQRGMFFLETARRVHDQVRRAGLIPIAWTAISCDDPFAEAEVAIKSMQTGYDGVVFELESAADGKGLAAKALGLRLLEAGLRPERLYSMAYPNMRQHPRTPYREMNSFCRGGFMPRCFPSLGRTARTVLDRWTYDEHVRWSTEWGDAPPLYPVLAAQKDEQADQRLSPAEFLGWAQALAMHDPPFYSVYRAGTVDRELWPILAALGESASLIVCRPAQPSVESAAPPISEPLPPLAVAPAPPPADTAPAPRVEPPPTLSSLEPTQPVAPLAPPSRKPTPVEPETIYHVVTVNDSVWSICQKHNLPRSQFWAWNGHLWDEHGLPRDALYLQEGWRVRVK